MTITDLLRQSPDAKTSEGARRLFFSRRWILLGGDGKWLWGAFKVNGPKPLQSAVDLINGRFYCSCRGRQRPCAHALSLVMILHQQPERITVGPTPRAMALHEERLLVTRRKDEVCDTTVGQLESKCLAESSRSASQ